MPWAYLAAAGIGAYMSYRSNKEKQAQAKQDKSREAEIARWPWSGMQAQRVAPAPSQTGEMLAGALEGRQTWGNIQQANQYNDNARAYQNYLRGQTNPQAQNPRGPYG